MISLLGRDNPNCFSVPTQPANLANRANRADPADLANRADPADLANRANLAKLCKSSKTTVNTIIESKRAKKRVLRTCHSFQDWGGEKNLQHVLQNLN